MKLEELRQRYVQIMQNGTVEGGVTEENTPPQDSNPVDKNAADRANFTGALSAEVLTLDINISVDVITVKAAGKEGNSLIQDTWSMTTSEGGNIPLSAFKSPQSAVEMLLVFKKESQIAGESYADLDESTQSPSPEPVETTQSESTQSETMRLGAKIRHAYQVKLFQKGGSMSTATIDVTYNKTPKSPEDENTGESSDSITVSAKGVPFSWTSNKILEFFEDQDKVFFDMGYRVTPQSQDFVETFTERTGTALNADLGQVYSIWKDKSRGAQEAATIAAKDAMALQNVQSQEAAAQETLAKLDNPELVKTSDGMSAMVAALEQEMTRMKTGNDRAIARAQRIQEVDDENARQRAGAANAQKDAYNTNVQAYANRDNINKDIAYENAQDRVDKTGKFISDTQRATEEDRKELAENVTKPLQRHEYEQEKQNLERDIASVQSTLQQAQLYQGGGLETRIAGFTIVQQQFSSLLDNLQPDNTQSIPPEQFANAAQQALTSAPDYQQDQQYYNDLAARLVTAIGGNMKVFVGNQTNPQTTNTENTSVTSPLATMKNNAQNFFNQEAQRLKNAQAQFASQNVNADTLRRQLQSLQEERQALDQRFMKVATEADQKLQGSLVTRPTQKVDKLANSRRAQRRTGRKITEAGENVGGFFSDTFSSLQQGGKIATYREWLRKNTL